MLLNYQQDLFTAMQLHDMEKAKQLKLEIFG